MENGAKWRNDLLERPTAMMRCPRLRALVHALKNMLSAVLGIPIGLSANLAGSGDHMWKMDIRTTVPLQEGYITVTPLGALAHAEIVGETYLKEWLPGSGDK
ncbi:uncharacterized protein LOC111393548 isoform X2 [Olea europaea var. sylvestris]|uniref:uncharacterized protein LOC111393548 isoform X2 n=1 Tax=Olea europaea var. sylvestris TaxID=158386 RepID=UPI000C1CFBBC|nr:uncharacterized protein LOC111393548 isoform X2 [Olea europaea var. sylvestris]